MSLFYCPQCRYPSAVQDVCPYCNLPRQSQAVSCMKRLIEAILSLDPSRAGMAVDVLTKWLHEPRAIVPLLLILQSDGDAFRLVMAARGLGWLGDRAAIPALIDLLFEKSKPFVARVAAVQALGALKGEQADAALRKATLDERPSVAQAAIQTLMDMNLPGQSVTNHPEVDAFLD